MMADEDEFTTPRGASAALKQRLQAVVALEVAVDQAKAELAALQQQRAQAEQKFIQVRLAQHNESDTYFVDGYVVKIGSATVSSKLFPVIHKISKAQAL